jgi:hypothetical protein
MPMLIISSKKIIEHFQRSNEHFSRESAPLGAFFLRQ